MALTRPNPGDPLSSSNTKSSTQIVDEAFDQVDAHELMLKGPAFRNPLNMGFDPSFTLIAGSVSLPGWFAHNYTSAPALSTFHSGGTNPPPTSITTMLNVGKWTNGNLTADFGWNLPTPVTVGNHTHIMIALYFDGPLGPEMVPSDAAEIVVSDGPNFTGHSVAIPPPGFHSQDTWVGFWVPLHSFTTVACIGIRWYKAIGTLYDQVKLYSNGVYWSLQTEIERAQAGTAPVSVIIPAAFTQGNSSVPFDSWSQQLPNDNAAVLDLRPGNEVLSNAGGIRHIREFQAIDPTGVRDCGVEIQQVFERLKPGETLQFDADGIYRTEANTGPRMTNLRNVTIDGNGCTFTRHVAGVMSSYFPVVNCVNLTVKNLNIVCTFPKGTSGSALTKGPGVGVSGTTATLTAQGHYVQLPAGAYHEDERGKIAHDITMSYTGTRVQPSQSDVYVEMIDAHAPPPPTLTQVGSMGAVGGVFHYRLSYIDAEGRETGMSRPAVIATTGTYCRVGVTIPIAPVIAGCPPIVARRIYRTEFPTMDQFNPQYDMVPFASEEYACVATINDNVTTFTHDNAPSGAAKPAAATFTATNAGAGNILPGNSTYWVTTVTANGGRESGLHDNDSTISKTVLHSGKVNLTGLPAPAGASARRIYRYDWSFYASVIRTAYLVAEQLSTDPQWAAGTYTDNMVAPTGFPLNRPPWAINGGTNTDFLPAGTNPAIGERVTLKGGATPTMYPIRFVPRGRDYLDRQFIPTIFRSHVGPQTITVHSWVDYCKRPNYVDGAAFAIEDDCQNVIIDNCDVTGYEGDHTWVGTRLDSAPAGTIIRNCRSIQNGRQGFAAVHAEDITYENCEIIAPGRSGLDVEPFGISTPYVKSIVMRNCTFRAVTNADIANNTMVANFELDNCRFTTTYGIAPFGFSMIGGRVSLRNVYAPWSQVTLTGPRPVQIDGLVARQLAVVPSYSADLSGLIMVGGGGTINNVKLNGALYNQENCFTCTLPDVMISNVSLNTVSPSNFDTFVFGGTHASRQGGPFNVQQNWTGADNATALLDPGPWKNRFPKTYKGTTAASLHFPGGLDMQEESALELRGISSTTTRANNLSGVAPITTGATSATVTFPTRAQDNLTSLATGGPFAIPVASGMLAPNVAYFWRAAARSWHGGPATWTPEVTWTFQSPNNSFKLLVTGVYGTTMHIEGITVLRGTASGVYNTRFDIIPSSPIHALSMTNPGSQTQFLDMGTTISGSATGVGDVTHVGYNLTYPITPTTEYVGSAALTGSNWNPVNQTGYEPDRSYRLAVTPSWPTTVAITAKRVNGFDVSFGTACPVGGGTFDWVLVR